MSQKRTQTSISGFFPKSATKIPKVSSNENQPENTEESEKEISENTEESTLEERERSENNEESLENSKEKNSFTMDRFVIKKPKMSISAEAGPSNLNNSVPNNQKMRYWQLKIHRNQLNLNEKLPKSCPKKVHLLCPSFQN